MKAMTIHERIGRALVAASVAVAAGVAVVIAGSVQRGLDLSDESLYLVTARRPEVAYRTFTGAHFLIAPVFALVGHRVPGLRLAKLIVTLAVAAGFGVALRAAATRLGGSDVSLAPARRRWLPDALVLASAGGALMIYAWTPVSPGYNDVSALAATAAGAATLMVLAAPTRRRWPLLLGAVHVCHLLTKWPAALLVGALCWTVVAVGLAGWRPFVRVLAIATAGAMAALAVIQLFLADVPRLLRGIRESTSAVSTSTNRPDYLIRLYRTDLTDLAKQVAVRSWWFVPAAVVVGLLERSGRRRWSAAAALLTAGAATAQSFADHLPVGGVPNIVLQRQLLPSCLAFALVVPIVHVVGRRSRQPVPPEGPGSGAARPRLQVAMVLAFLLALPMAQAFGTGNPLTYIAPMAAPPWVGVLVLLARRADRRSAGAVLLSTGAVAMTVVLVASVAFTGVRRHPYRIAGGLAAQTTAVDVPALRGLRVAPDQAAFLDDLTALYRSQHPVPGQRAFALWSLPGLAFAVGAVAPGDAWLSPNGIERTAATIRSACLRDPELRRGQRPFLFVLANPVPSMPAVVADAIGSCGAPFPACYAPAGSLTVPFADRAPDTLTLWAPTRAAGC